MDTSRIYAVHYFNPRGESWRLVGQMLPLPKKRVRVRWHQERWDAEEQAWVKQPISIFDLPPRSQLMRLVGLIRNDARFLGYRVSERGLLPYIPTSDTL
jgi:IS5 family transposase